MGKTYRRKNDDAYWAIHSSKEKYIKKHVDQDYLNACNRGYVWEKIPKEEYQSTYEKMLENYNQAMKEYDRLMFIYYNNRATWMYNHGNDRLFSLYYKSPEKPYNMYPSKNRRVAFHGDYERFYNESYKEHSDYYDKMTRDGVMSETGRSSGFKSTVARERRRKDKAQLHKVKLDIDAADDMVWYDRKDGKDRIWDFW